MRCRAFLALAFWREIQKKKNSLKNVLDRWAAADVSHGISTGAASDTYHVEANILASRELQEYIHTEIINGAFLQETGQDLGQRLIFAMEDIVSTSRQTRVVYVGAVLLTIAR